VPYPTLTMSMGQVSEVLFMLLLPLGLRFLGFKWVLFVGMLAWVIRYVAFSFGAPDTTISLIALGILLHGVCYDFFFVTGQIYVDKRSSPQIRGRAQGFLVWATLGVGMLIGLFASGQLFAWTGIADLEGQALKDAYYGFWLYPAGFAAAVMLGFVLFFKDDPQASDEQPAPHESPEHAGPAETTG